MTLHPFRSRFSQLRAFLIVAALISLCLSSNVGPRFLPLPSVTDPEGKELQVSQGITASRSRSERESFRVPIMAQTQKRADREAQPHPLDVTLRVGFVVANDTRVATEFRDVSHLFTSTSVSQPAGRAPPRLV